MVECTPSKKIYCGWAFIIFGIACVLVAVFVPPFINTMLEDGIDARLILKQSDMDNDNDAWKYWSDTSLPDSFAPNYLVYVWNITNPYEILNGSAANVSQVGPYYYTQQTLRFNVTFMEDEQHRPMVQCREWTYWVYNAELTASNLSESDVYTSLNGPFFELISAFNGFDDFLYSLYPNRNFTDYDRMFTTRNVSEMMWGYYDPVLEKANQRVSGISPYYTGTLGPNVTSQDLCYNTTWTYPSQCGLTTYITGEYEAGQVSQYYEWNDMDTITVQPSAVDPRTEMMWNGTLASRIWGTSGTGWHKHINKNEGLVAWVPSLFKRVTLLYNYTDYTVKGIKLWKFILDPQELVNCTGNSFNCYYGLNVTGTLDVSKAWTGIPVTMTQPHFLNADPSVQAMANGMDPNNNLHNTYVGVEPTTGQVFDGHSRIQPCFKVWPMNITALNGTRQETWLKNVWPGIIIPTCWVELEGVIPSNLADDFKNSVYVAQDLSYYLFWIASILGAAIIFTGVVGVHRYAVIKGQGGRGELHESLTSDAHVNS